MFSNFTEETCTGTAEVLTLLGSTSGNIPFSASFEDGEKVAYSLEDSAGSIKISGIGTYSAGTITRKDLWNYNGTVVDKTPTANIVLSGGTHTIRCAASDASLHVPKNYNNPTSFGLGVIGDNFRGMSQNNSNSTITPNKLLAVTHVFNKAINIKKISCQVQTAGAAGEIIKLGIWENLTTRKLGKALFESGPILVDSTGYKSVALDLKLPPGLYEVGIITNSSTVSLRAYAGQQGDMTAGVDVFGVSYLGKDSPTLTGWEDAPIGDTPIDASGQISLFNVPYVYFNAGFV